MNKPMKKLTKSRDLAPSQHVPGVKITFSGMTSLLNFIKTYQLIEGTGTQTGW
jgi:hypothetical protein